MRTYSLSARKNARTLAPDDEGGSSRGVFLPRLISWNTTIRCNLRCPHCYLDAGGSDTAGELSTDEAKQLIDRIAAVSSPLFIFSGGEPLLRGDIFELIQYAAGKGLRTALGTNGTLITAPVAERLASSGVKAAAVSIDSSLPGPHDRFRGVKGSWKRAVQGIGACIRSGIAVQVNTTVTPQNYDDIPAIMSLAEGLGARSFHLFFLVPTGRGAGIRDIAADQYEHLIGRVLDMIAAAPPVMHIRPVCAPQFLRIASRKGIDLAPWGRGCVAGLTYCRIGPTGELTPCPYLPLTAGNIRQTDFADLWFHAPLFRALRDRRSLTGRCGRCEYREICGGCRARAHGLTGAPHGCSGLHRPGDGSGDYLAEDPWCLYQPGGEGS